MGRNLKPPTPAATSVWKWGASPVWNDRTQSSCTVNSFPGCHPTKSQGLPTKPTNLLCIFYLKIVHSQYVFNVYHTWNIHNIYYLHITIYMKWYIHMYCIYGCLYTYKLKKKFTNLTALTWYDLNWIDWNWHALNWLYLLHMTLPVPRGVSWPILAAAGNSDVVVHATDVGRNFCITIVNRLKQGIPPTWIGIAKLISLINIWNRSSCWLSQVNHMIQ